ncbi:MAG: YicC/YloC family endoribonuclease [Phycisphaerales bacterium JB061]
MIRSMTGYGEASAHIDGTHYFVQIRSLNGKFFKGTVRLQEEFESLEADLESRLRKQISRGSVTLKASCTDDTEAAAHEINCKALDKYVEQLSASEHVSSGRVSIEIGSLLGLPGVIQPPSDEGERIGRVREVFTKLTNEACASLIAMRKAEGEALAADLHNQLSVIATSLAEVKERAPEIVKDFEARLRTRMDELLAGSGTPSDSVDIIREVASHAERTDIAEEIQRLGGHLEQFTKIIEQKDDKPVGRTLDFMAQELLREANTMSSKSMDTRISRSIVEIKGAIDRIKEQVQNVE